MKTSTKAMPLLLEFVGSATTSAILYAALSRSGLQLLGAMSVGFVFAGFLAASLPKYFVQINPLVTIAMWLSQKVSHLQALFTLAAQALGAVAAWQVIEFIIDRPLNSLAKPEFDPQIFAAEIVGAFIFMFMLSLVINRDRIEESRVIFVAFASITVGMIVASLATSSYGLVNPFIAIGIQSLSWTFATGSLVGGIVGMSIVPIASMIDNKGTKTSTLKAKKKKKTTKKK